MIEFPNLFGGIVLKIGRVAFSIANLPIYWYGIIIACAFILAILLAIRASKKFGLQTEDVIDLALFTVPSAIIGARIYYVVFEWNRFADNPLDIFNPRTGGLAIYGGIIGAFIAVYFVAKFKKMSFLNILDFGAPYLVLGQAIGRWGNFVNQEAFGTNTDLPWGMTGDMIKAQLISFQHSGMNIDNLLPVHPTFLYESIVDFLIFFILIAFRNKKKHDGEVVAIYLMLYGFARFFIESLRTDSLMVAGLRVSQILSAVIVILMVIMFIALRTKRQKKTREKATVAANIENIPIPVKDDKILLTTKENIPQTISVENKLQFKPKAEKIVLPKKNEKKINVLDEINRHKMEKELKEKREKEKHKNKDK